MDGINGITGFYSIVTILGLLGVNYYENLIDNDLLIYVLMSVVIFGFYNFRKKARMFAGDIGSISIAVLLCFVGALFLYKIKSPVLLLFISVYSVDAILTIIYRKSIGESLTEPHRKHIYQKMVHTLKYSHLSVAAIYGLLQLIINAIVLLTYKLSLMSQLTVFLVVNLTIVGLYLLMFKKVEKVKQLS